MTHRSGLPRHDLVWYNNLTLSRKQLVERLRYLEPNEDLRAKWQYNNLMFVTAGYLAGQLTGGTWEEAVRTRVFKPLDMSNTNFSVEESRKSDDFALPYEEKDDQLREMAFRNITTVGPAGSVNSNIDDMIKWIRVHLNRGKAGERRILSEATAQDLHTPYMVISVLPEEPEVSPGSYALGWMTDTYRGHYRVRHGGGIDGFTALVTLYPRDGVGMVVLANKSGTGLPGLVTLHGSDLALGLAYKDWNGEALAKWKTAKQAQKEAEEKARTLRKTGTKPAHPLEAYAGDYEHPGYGILQINVQDQQLAMGFNGITTSLEHWHYETFNGLENPVDRTFEDVKLTFRTNQRGNVEAVSAPFDPLVPEIVFTRKAEDRMSDPQYLRRFVGVYELLDKEITIGIEGCVLTLYVPGQPVYELVPDREDEFKLKGLAGFSVRFETSEDGTIKAFINQPNGVFEVTRKSPK